MQKEQIKTVIESHSSFFSAEDLLQQLPTIGTATIYRYLAQERKRGTLHSYLCQGRRLYSRGKTSHCHFTCEQCKCIRHIELAKLDFLHAQLQGSICHVQVDITGVCPECLNRKNQHTRHSSKG